MPNMDGPLPSTTGDRSRHCAGAARSTLGGGKEACGRPTALLRVRGFFSHESHKHMGLAKQAALVIRMHVFCLERQH